MSKEPTEFTPKHLSDLLRDECSMAGYLTNLPGSGRELLSHITRAMGPADVSAEQMQTEIFPMTYFYAHPCEMENDRTGDTVRQVRVVLMTEEFKTASFISLGVVGSMDLLRQHLGHGPWVPPLKVQLEIKKSAAKRNVYRLITH